MAPKEHIQSARRYFVYHNLTIFLASIVFAYALMRGDFFHGFFLRIGELGYIGAFLVGMFFPSSFTVIPATAILLTMRDVLDLLPLAVFAGAGSTVGDYLIFRFVRDGLTRDLSHLFSGFGGNRVTRLLHSKYFGMLTPIIGALIIASPLPDELGVGLLGISNIRSSRFVVLSFCLNTFGIFMLLGALSLVT